MYDGLERKASKRWSVLSDRLQRQLDRFLDECEAALGAHQWVAARDAALAALGIEPENTDAQGFLAAAQRALAGTAAVPSESSTATRREIPSAPEPTSFCDGRYLVVRF